MVRPGGEEGEVGGARAGVLGDVGQRREIEGRPADRRHVEADRDRMVRRDVVAVHAEVLAQRRVEAVGQNDQPGGNLLAGRQRHGLALVADGDRRGLAVDDRRPVGGNRAAHGVDQPVVENAVLAARLAVGQPAGAHDPVLPVGARRGGDDLAEPGPGEQADLLLVELLAAEIRRIDLVRVDEHGVDPGPAEHGGRRRSGEPASDDGNVRMPHVSDLTAPAYRSGPEFDNGA